MKRIVIVGGGAGGLELATYLGCKLGKRKRAQVILVDRDQTHLWKPLLHEIATGSLDDGVDALSYRAHARSNNFSFRQGTVTGLNRETKELQIAPIYGIEGDIVVEARTISYDYLVLAIGSKSNDFNTKGVAENCIFLDSTEQALKFHHKMMELFLRFGIRGATAEEKNMPLDPSIKVNVIIVGAGATGVELSAELYNAAQYLSFYGYGRLHSESLQVTLLDSGNRILSVLPEKISITAKKELEKLGAKIKTNIKVVEARKDGVLTQDGEFFPADLIVWAAGIRVSDITKQFDGLEINHINQIKIKNTLQTTVDECIFAIGDCSSLLQKNQKPVPARAQAAHQMAKVCGKNIVALFNNKNNLQEFVFRDNGSLVSLSNFSAIGDLMSRLSKDSIKVEGYLARIFYVSLYRMHQVALHGYIKTGLIMLVGRINRFIRPSLKLH